MSLRLLADVNIPRGLVERLRADGHDVLWALEQHARTADHDLGRIAEREGRVVLTEDMDFGELAVRHRMPLPGQVLIELHQLEMDEMIARVVSALVDIGGAAVGLLSVIEPARVRGRSLPLKDKPS